MVLKYDLHCHSTASDGSLSPQQVVQAANAAAIDVLALTDHDVTDGLQAAENEAEKLGLRLLKGVEISVSWEKSTIHILGLGINPEHQALQQGLAGLREFRDWRAMEIGRRLDKAGIKGAYEGAKAYSNGNIISRTHFARFLVEQGYAKDVRAVFKHFLINNRPGFVAGQWAQLADAVAWITGSGGQAVIAHPARYRISQTKLRQLIEAFLEAGGCGLEVVSSSHAAADTHKMAQLAVRYKLYASCGSDFHSHGQAWARLGQIPAIPTECTPIWETWSN